MKAVQLTSINTLELAEIPEPGLPGKGQVLLKVEVVGVCGSDIHYFKTGRIGEQLVEFPFIVGHEFSATVIEAGPETENFKAGDRVAVDPAMSCGYCDQCMQGRENTCLNLSFLGCPGQEEGVMKEKVIMPANCCYLIPDTMTFDEAVMVEPLSIGYYAATRSSIKHGQNIGILGAGPIGCSVLLSVKHFGAGASIITEKIDERLNIALELGADHAFNVEKCNVLKKVSEVQPNLLDTVFECSGDQDAFDQGIELLKPGGTLVLVGIPEFDRWSFRADTSRRKEISIIHIRRQNGCVQDAIDLIASGRCNFNSMLTHHFSLDESQLAFETVASYKDGVMKALLDLRL